MLRTLSLLATTFFALAMAFFSPSQVFAAIPYNGGEYINLCGTGEAANAHTCNRGCDINSGRCTAPAGTVVKFTCDGRQANCTDNESNWSSSQSIGSVSCGKTVQIDVFNKKCRNTTGGWDCNDSGDLRDYIVWYSGDCPAATATPTPRPTSTPRPSATPTPVPHTSTCSSLQVVSGADQTSPARVTLRATASDSAGNIQMYRFLFGDGNRLETTEREVTHTYEMSGRFHPAVEVKDSRGNWISRASCQTSFTLRAPAVESFKSGCSEVRILEGNHTRAPSTAKFEVTGFDNKSGLQEYRLDFGNGITKDQNGSNFEQRYDKPGTYTVRAYVKDSQGNWKGGDSNCRATLYVETEPLKEQPKTGTPTLLSVAAVTSGIVGTVALLRRQALLKTRA